jgi:hypothetical protein
MVVARAVETAEGDDISEGDDITGAVEACGAVPVRAVPVRVVPVRFIGEEGGLPSAVLGGGAARYADPSAAITRYMGPAAAPRCPRGRPGAPPKTAPPKTVPSAWLNGMPLMAAMLSSEGGAVPGAFAPVMGAVLGTVLGACRWVGAVLGADCGRDEARASAVVGGAVVDAADGGAGGALCFRSGAVLGAPADDGRNLGAVLGAPADDGRNLLPGISAALGTALGMSTATTALGAVAGAVMGAVVGAVAGAVVGAFAGAVVGADVGADVGAVVAVARRGERGEPSAGDGTGAVLSAPPACVGSHVSQLRRGSASVAPETALGGRARTREGGRGGWGARAPGTATLPS